MGVYFDAKRNNVFGEEAFISFPHSSKIIVIPTDEEVMIARDVLRLGDIG